MTLKYPPPHRTKVLTRTSSLTVIQTQCTIIPRVQDTVYSVKSASEYDIIFFHETALQTIVHSIRTFYSFGQYATFGWRFNKFVLISRALMHRKYWIMQPACRKLRPSCYVACGVPHESDLGPILFPIEIIVSVIINYNYIITHTF